MNDAPPSPSALLLLRRRRLVSGAAWAMPAVALASAAPAMAASSPCTLSLITTGLSDPSASTSDLYLRDKKTTNSNTNTSATNTSVVNLKVQLSCAPLPAGATIDFVPDNVLDGQGNYMVAAVPTSTTGSVTSSPTKQSATGVVPDSSGYAIAKIGTTTYSKDDCGSIPRSGVLTITARAAGGSVLATLALTYTVYDGAVTVSCP